MTFNAADVILSCLNSLEVAEGVKLKVVVVDNRSADDTVAIVRNWSLSHTLDLKILEAPMNNGFAAGVNLGLNELRDDPALDRFWILNPDCAATPETPRLLAMTPMPFALLGCRITYADPSHRIQIDGGTLNRWTGATGNLNLGRSADATPPPNPSEMDFISGASMVASRAFLKEAGPMPEHYFLYYEEVDWAQKRDHLPLAYCDGARVFHLAGSSIGSPTLDRGPSPLSVYFKHRARMRFVAAHRPARMPVAYLFGLGKALQHVQCTEWAALTALLRALHGFPPPKAVRAVIGPQSYAATKARIVSNKPA